MPFIRFAIAAIFSLTLAGAAGWLDERDPTTLYLARGRCRPLWLGHTGDGLYFAYWLEEACNGTLGTILINMRTMHYAGIGYHCGREGLSMSQVGAHARHAGKFDVMRYFQARTKGSEA